ncbi:unnamed protein product [Closterium sp. NIES-65]|nr:unnamed protein product [Closterium sp. NIES-65]CAI6011140.1 unnamed protein product [Closterium sp. NIES-65]CAI6011143.1 unnamed protein product [Closterium sp. NIES-65]CAI6012848.1 unnamed protein product [Closterium sp. NIES-65]
MGQALGSTQQWQYDQLELVYELDGLRTSYIRKFFQDYRFDILAPARVIVIKAFNIDTTVGVREPGVNNGKMEMSAFCGTYRAGIIIVFIPSFPPSLQIPSPTWIHPFFPSLPLQIAPAPEFIPSFPPSPSDRTPPLDSSLPSLPFRSHLPLNSSLLSLPPLQIAPAPEFIPSFPPSPSDRTPPLDSSLLSLRPLQIAPAPSSLLSLPPLQIAPAPEFIPSFPPSPSDRTRP